MDRIERFDAGGIMRPGTTLAVNATGRDEHARAAPPLHAIAAHTFPVHAMTAPVVTITSTLHLDYAKFGGTVELRAVHGWRGRRVQEPVVEGRLASQP